jgi:anaerobic magnesium-protoporphyrin IX monomethyl ester cyclase
MRVTFYDCGYGMLGVQYNMACLMQAGHEVDLFFDNSMSMDHLADAAPMGRLFSLTLDQVVRGILDTKPQMVCFSTPTYFYQTHRRLMRALKRAQPELIICCGGVHPTLVPNTVCEKPEIDFMLVGEGEYAFPKLVSDIEKHGADAVKAMPRDAHPGCWNLLNGEIVDRGMAPTVKNLDDIPFPEKRLHYKANPALQPIYATLASRGCVFTCTFCNSASLNTKFREDGNSKFYRYRSVDNVIKELKWAKETYNPSFVQFFDDIFAVKRSWLVEFNEKYKREIGLPFEIQTNPKIHDEESMRLLADCGCVHTEFGFQSASPEVRREMLSRKESNQEVKDLIRAARKMGMLMELDLIVNLPGETEAEIQENIDFVQDVRPELVNVSFLQYFPKTPIIQTAIEHGILSQSDLPLINEGEMVTSMRRLNAKLTTRYHILPFQMYFAAHFPRPVANFIIGFIGFPGLRIFFARFGNLFLYLTRIWVGLTDSRDFYHRRHIPRALYAAFDVLKRNYWTRDLSGGRPIPAPADTTSSTRLPGSGEAR